MGKILTALGFDQSKQDKLTDNIRKGELMVEAMATVYAKMSDGTKKQGFANAISESTRILLQEVKKRLEQVEAHQKMVQEQNAKNASEDSQKQNDVNLPQAPTPPPAATPKPRPLKPSEFIIRNEPKTNIPQPPQQQQQEESDDNAQRDTDDNDSRDNNRLPSDSDSSQQGDNQDGSDGNQQDTNPQEEPKEDAQKPKRSRKPKVKEPQDDTPPPRRGRKPKAQEPPPRTEPQKPAGYEDLSYEEIQGMAQEIEESMVLFDENEPEYIELKNELDVLNAYIAEVEQQL